MDTAKTKKQLIAELDELRQKRAVEQAANHIRDEVLAMRQSEDMTKVVAALFQEMVNLGIETPSSSIQFVEEGSALVRLYGANSEGVQFQEVPIEEMWGVFKEEWNKGEVWTETYQGRYVTNVPFTLGTVGFNEVEFNQDHVAIVQTLTEALSLGYMRFLDFHQLEQANTQIQQATQRKSQFLRRMSHDLRSPMNAIIGYSRLLQRRLADRMDEREARNLSNIQTSSRNLLNLINDILDLSRIEADRIEVNVQPVDVRTLAGECADALESIVQEGVVLRRELDDVEAIRSDPDRLRQVVMNLLGNATKFTGEGSITLSLRRVDGAAELSVADTGIGIPSEDLPHIFDEFRQVERQGGEQTEGTGLGLAIAKKTVELLGGTISAESEVGAGTKFTLRITDYEKKDVA